MNYEQDIKIDETALDIEWLEQPSLMMKYAGHSALMLMKLDLAKESLDMIRSEIDRDIRSNPEKFGIAKITETAIQGAILLDERWIEETEIYRNSKYEADMAQAAVRAVAQRKDALENLVRLHSQQYFAGPKIPRDLSHEWNEKQNKVHEKISIKRSKRTK